MKWSGRNRKPAKCIQGWEELVRSSHACVNLSCLRVSQASRRCCALVAPFTDAAAGWAYRMHETTRERSVFMKYLNALI